MVKETHLVMARPGTLNAQLFEGRYAMGKERPKLFLKEVVVRLKVALCVWITVFLRRNTGNEAITLRTNPCSRIVEKHREPLSGKRGLDMKSGALPGFDRQLNARHAGNLSAPRPCGVYTPIARQGRTTVAQSNACYDPSFHIDPDHFVVDVLDA
ncbi:hypothetical protein D9M70_517650 [compost metagenome]